MAGSDWVVLTVEHDEHDQAVPWPVVEEHLQGYLAGGPKPPSAEVQISPGRVRLTAAYSPGPHLLPVFDPEMLHWAQGLLDILAALQGAAPAEPAAELLSRRVAASRSLLNAFAQ